MAELTENAHSLMTCRRTQWLRPALLSVFLLAAALVSASCSSPSDDTPDSGMSSDATDSMSDTNQSDGDDDADNGLLEVGESCTTPGSCVEGAACVGDETGDQFQCMRICGEAGRVCDDGSFCTARLNAPPVCYTLGDTPEGSACTVNLECELGSLCFGSSPNQFCIRGCHALDDVCLEGEYCDATNQRGPCRSIVGADCETSVDCREGLSCTAEQDDPLGSNLPRGYCTELDCASDDDCPYESVCRTPPGTETAICMQPCDFESDCRFNHDYTCLGPTECGDTNNRDACGRFLGSQKLCVPTDYTSNF